MYKYVRIIMVVIIVIIIIVIIIIIIIMNDRLREGMRKKEIERFGKEISKDIMKFEES